MTSNNSNYKIKHIVSLNPDLIKGKFFNFTYEDEKLLCRITRVASEILEFYTYTWNEKLNQTKDIDYEILNEVINNDYEFFIMYFYEDEFSDNIDTKDIGTFTKNSTSYVSFKDIEKSENPLTKKLKYLILNEYENLIYNNKEQLSQKEINYKKELLKKEKLLKEIKEMEFEREKKRKELEVILNSNKPKNKPDYLKIIR